jgi:hypothetical protein
MSGCLTAERKEYQFHVNPDGSGTGTITFYNLMSADEESKNMSAKDYQGMINDFYKGKKFEEQNPAFGNVRKRIYEKDGVLNGEITYDFLNYEDAGLYRYQGKGPWMYYPASPGSMSTEHFDSTNGQYISDRFPIIVWPEGTADFRLTTSVDRPGPTLHSLLPYYKRGGTD